MTSSSDEVADTLATLIVKSKIENYDELLRQFRHALENLAQKGVVKFGPDYKLGGDILAIRVQLILSTMGLSVTSGRESLEDLIVAAPKFAANSYPYPLVMEVKSGKWPSPTREHLRQLDDWVFELSGEGEIRRSGLEKYQPNRSYVSIGAIQPAPTHPKPHKGVFVYNGPLSKPFDQRPHPMLSKNEEEFSVKRSFCVISLPCLLSWASACKKSSELVEQFWFQVQTCMGELGHFNDK